MIMLTSVLSSQIATHLDDLLVANKIESPRPDFSDFETSTIKDIDSKMTNRQRLLRFAMEKPYKNIRKHMPRVDAKVDFASNHIFITYKDSTCCFDLTSDKLIFKSLSEENPSPVQQITPFIFQTIQALRTDIDNAHADYEEFKNWKIEKKEEDLDDSFMPDTSIDYGSNNIHVSSSSMHVPDNEPVRQNIKPALKLLARQRIKYK